MAYTDYSSHWSLDTFLTYLEANTLGSNDEHLYDTFAVEHNINTATVDGTHDWTAISIPKSTGSQLITTGATWTPSAGLYQISIAGVPVASAYMALEIYVSASWRSGSTTSGLILFDGSNMRLASNYTGSVTIYYQKF